MYCYVNRVYKIRARLVLIRAREYPNKIKKNRYHLCWNKNLHEIFVHFLFLAQF